MRAPKILCAISIAALLSACQTNMHTFSGNVPQLDQAIETTYGGSVHAMMADSQHAWLVFNYLYNERFDLLAHMYKSGLDVDWNQAQLGATPLAVAFNHKDLSPRAVGFLLNHGASMERAEREAGSKWAALTPLEAAVQRKSLGLMRHALLGGATKFEGRAGEEGQLAALQAVQDSGNWALAEVMNTQGIDNGFKAPTQIASGQATGGQQPQQAASDDNTEIALFGMLAGAVIGQTVGGMEGEVFSQAIGGALAAGETSESGNPASVLSGAAGILGATGIPGMDADTAMLIGAAELFGEAVSGQKPTLDSVTAPAAVGASASGSGTTTGAAKVSSTKPSGPATPYIFSCPMGSGPHTVQVPASNITACPAAMKIYARAMTCNLIDEQEASQKAYYQICAAEIYAQ